MRTSETVGKALAILDCLTAHGTALGTGEIATLTRIHRSTVARPCLFRENSQHAIRHYVEDEAARARAR